MKTQFVTSADGTCIAYDVTGSGPALVLLHGAGKTRKDWHKAGYVERLKQDFSTITVDIRGTGESDFLTDIADYKVEKICADVNAVADACGAQHFLVWGYSFGGNIARYLGAWSDRVRGMAVIGVPFGPAVDEAFDRYIDEFIQKYGQLGQEYVEGRLNDKKRQAAVKGGIPAWIACFQAMRGWPRIDPGQVRCPTMLLSGTKNKAAMNWIESNRAALDAGPIRVEIIEGLNHPQEFSQIERVYPVASAFLKSLDAG